MEVDARQCARSHKATVGRIFYCVQTVSDIFVAFRGYAYRLLIDGSSETPSPMIPLPAKLQHRSPPFEIKAGVVSTLLVNSALSFKEQTNLIRDLGFNFSKTSAFRQRCGEM